MDLADLAKRVTHADRKVSGSKDKGGAWVPWVELRRFDGSLVNILVGKSSLRVNPGVSSEGEIIIVTGFSPCPRPVALNWN